MIWLFALGIIGFCLVHQGFRKVVFWIGGLTAAFIAVCLVISTRPRDPPTAYVPAVATQSQDPLDMAFPVVKTSSVDDIIPPAALR